MYGDVRVSHGLDPDRYAARGADLLGAGVLRDPDHAVGHGYVVPGGEYRAE